MSSQPRTLLVLVVCHIYFRISISLLTYMGGEQKQTDRDTERGTETDRQEYGGGW